MTKLEQQLRAVGVINTWDLLKRFATASDDLVVEYHAGTDGRGGRPPRTVVWSTRRNTDPDAHWQDHKSKTFHGIRATSWQKAVAWACKETGTQPSDWAGNPVNPRRSVLLKVVRDRVLAVLGGTR